MAAYKALVFLLVVFGMAVAAPKETTNFKDAQVAETQQVVVESQKISPVQYKSASDLKTSETQETQKESLETSESFGLGYYAGHHLGLAAIPDALPLAVKYPVPVYATYLSYYPGYYHSYRHHGYGGYGHGGFGYNYGVGVLH